MAGIFCVSGRDQESSKTRVRINGSSPTTSRGGRRRSQCWIRREPMTGWREQPGCNSGRVIGHCRGPQDPGPVEDVKEVSNARANLHRKKARLGGDTPGGPMVELCPGSTHSIHRLRADVKFFLPHICCLSCTLTCCPGLVFLSSIPGLTQRLMSPWCDSRNRG